MPSPTEGASKSPLRAAGHAYYGKRKRTPFGVSSMVAFAC
jgi:hypothetical protein